MTVITPEMRFATHALKFEYVTNHPIHQAINLAQLIEGFPNSYTSEAIQWAEDMIVACFTHHDRNMYELAASMPSSERFKFA